ncbi:class I SAM-dependent methyltransferase [Actinoplanes sp. Pm04-4]|uniref:Class I SAM-dependent methyltransferase n=1 Tax=Paractinoplanes pyxinae TaxID=2997416 RepID=A0ABT4AZK7_9ACTN|nr:class I SAM-dependent methyltransferase [Actinoplanes pyxinae]MCY1138855.1 class I SAM-dependent methyltransferase [Actinoplanes pyxinae]
MNYDDRQHLVYARARALTPDRLTEWLHVFARHAPERRPLAVLDLGSGTGRFTPALAAEFGGPVWGVEPSDHMRAVAEQHGDHPGVTYLAGSATEIPLPDDSCDLVLLFLVLHHVRDHHAAAAEVARVLRPGGRVLIRSLFPDRMPELPWYSYFPGARLIDEQVFPRLDPLLVTFAGAGLRFVTVERVQERIADSLADYENRLKLRGSSTFERLTELEIIEGFDAIEAAVRAERQPRQVEEESDLLVLEKG